MTFVTTKNGYFLEHRVRYYSQNYLGVNSPIRTNGTVLSWVETPSTVKNKISVPDYKVLIARKSNATGLYSHTVYKSSITKTASCSYGPKPDWPSWILDDKVYGTDTFRFVPDAIVGPFLEPSDDAVRDQALARIKRKLASNQGQFEAMIPLAQIHQLRGSIKQAANMAKDLIEALAAIRKTKGRSASRYAAGVWLNFNFGVLPVISDARSAAQAIGNFLTRQDRNLVLTGTSEKVWADSLKQTNISGNPAASVKMTAEFRHRLLYSYTGGFYLRVSAGNNYTALDHLGFNFKDLPAVGWEIIPYSWVVDYFTTAGEFMSDLFESPAGDLVYLSLAKKYDLTATASYEYYTQPNPLTILTSNSGGAAQTEHVNFSRQSLGSLPHRALRFKTIDEIGLHSVTKVINLASILLK
jgi:hypothetical protein